MSKKIVVLTSSPRKDGNSNTAAEAFVKIAKASGHDVIRFDAAENHVHGCKACDKCFSNGKACDNDDDFNKIAPDLETADAIVFAVPLYWFTFPAQIKAVIDKFYSLASEGKDFSGKECGMIVCCEDDNITTMEPIVQTYKGIIDYLEWNDLGVVLITGVAKPGDINKTDGIIQTEELAAKF